LVAYSVQLVIEPGVELHSYSVISTKMEVVLGAGQVMASLVANFLV